ncbi:MAG: leucine--tRNA ligase [Chryseobacterium sp.]|nr:MAG: leucine--tRNA ligase [Chryseobacterium sp.]
MFYDHRAIEKKWQQYWQQHETFKTSNNTELPKYYVLDMFPYPSGAGLHVGHPLGYIASDIVSRYKRHRGFNVLHPIGYDSFGLPAEQYAIQTGQHPAVTTEQNISRYEEQLKRLGFSFDWSRQLRTSDASYYKWTQWIFIQLFHSWYNKETDKAEPIDTLVAHFEKFGTEKLNAAQTDELSFTADEWNNASELEKQDILLNYRLAFRAETTVNWCPQLGTVLANDEVKDGKSERGGYPVYQKKMMQWSMRITAYSERLLQGLDNLDWPQPLKDAQIYWIGKSQGAEIDFDVLTPALSNGEGGTRPNYMTGGANSKVLLHHAKNMRHEPTKAEDVLWQALRNHALGDKFRRQHPIRDYIVDFVCLEKKLVVEVDGDYHFNAEQTESDNLRSLELNLKGYDILRFTNEEVLNNTDAVLGRIKAKLQEIAIDKPSDSPLPRRGAGGEDTVKLRVFTTRPDTIFGATFMVLAPEHPLVEQLATEAQKAEVEAYREKTALRTERDRMADVKNVSGAFTGSYAVNPFSGKQMPIYISDYVLMGYGTGAVMAVPAHDERDHRFAKHFGLEITKVIDTDVDVREEAFSAKDRVCVNSDFLDGLRYEEANARIVDEIIARGIGEGTTNYKQRDAIFSRQRYWGEPVPIYYKDGMPMTLPDSALPLELPEVEKYLPTEAGDPPLGNARNYAWDEVNEKVVATELIDNETVFPLELSTMPGWAGSSWYFLRYMDPQNDEKFVNKELADYWGQVDLYIGGSEHATGHLLYSRFWNMFLKDRGYVRDEEPFKKLINQGMILGMSAFVFRIDGTNRYVSKNLAGDYSTQKIHVDISLLKGTTDELDIEAFKKWRPEFADAEFVLEDGKYIVEREVEKMSKSKYNVVNPDDIADEYGADCLRLYEMFLGPLEQSKPWNTQGLSGVYGFLKKFWNLYFNSNDEFEVTDVEPTKAEYKILHTLIKKAQADIENFSFNTSVSSFMIAVNELSKLKTNKRAILEPLAIVISTYAPHIAEELWQWLGHSESIEYAAFPAFDESYLVDDEMEYPVSFNGKMRFKIRLSTGLSNDEIEEKLFKDERTAQYMDDKPLKKLIIVPKKIINIVI